MTHENELRQIEKELADKGKLIEAGFASFVLIVYGKVEEIPRSQLVQLRCAYMAGAQHLFSAIMDVLDPGEEPTERDMMRMNLISKELTAFYDEMKASFKELADGKV